MAIGTSGNQFKNAGVAGALMAEIIDRVSSGHNHDENPIEFDLTRSNSGTVNSASFSRRRDILNTSNSVLG